MNSDPHILGIPARDVLRSILNKWSLPSSPQACGLSSPAFLGDAGKIELSHFINFSVGDQFIRKGEMEDSEEVNSYVSGGAQRSIQQKLLQ